MYIKMGNTQNSPNRYNIDLFLIFFICSLYVFHPIFLKNLAAIFKQLGGALYEVDRDTRVAPREVIVVETLSQTHLRGFVLYQYQITNILCCL